MPCCEDIFKVFLILQYFKICLEDASHLFCYEEFEDIKGVTRIRKSKKNGQHNGQKKKGQKDKQRSTKHMHKTKDRVTRTSLKTRVNSGAPDE
jgi:hypothetical protein